MTSCIKISEITLLAYHAVALIARSKSGSMGGADIALVTQKSQHTLHKVMQRLAKEGIVESSRGRGGGFILKKRPEEVALLTVYEMFEGKIADLQQLLEDTDRVPCLGGLEQCMFASCLFGTVVRDLDRQFVRFMASSTIADLMK